MRRCKCAKWKREEAGNDISVDLNEWNFCPYCGFGIKDRKMTKDRLRELANGLTDDDLRTLRAIINGKLSKRVVTLEQQAKMQAARQKVIRRLRFSGVSSAGNAGYTKGWSYEINHLAGQNQERSKIMGNAVSKHY